ncbi:hypothetical protein [Aurantivibrio plasticivorans]
MTTRIQIINTSEIDPTLNQQLWELYKDAHAIDFEQFSSRHQQLDKVALCWDKRTERLVGCIGIRFQELPLDKGNTVPTLYFGQVYILPEYRGRLLVQRTVIRLMLHSKVRHPFKTAYFWTDALSYKPYLVMANNLAEYYPSPLFATPPAIHSLMLAIGKRYYTDSFQEETCTVHKPFRLLTDKSVVITERDFSNPIIRFYAERNAGDAEGDGLLLVCPMSIKNLLHFAWRRLRPRRSSRPEYVR